MYPGRLWGYEVILLVLVAQVASGQFIADSVRQRAQLLRQTMKNKFQVGVSAHRGASQVAPENTLATFRAALAMEVDYIEIDVRTTKDGELVILHDGSLNRTTNGNGPVKDKTLAELKQLSAGKGFDERFRAEQIPTLKEVCQLLANWNADHAHHTNLYVDCKEMAPQPVVELLAKYNLLANAVFYGSDAALLALKQVAPTARLMPSLKSETELAGKISQLNPYAFDVSWQSLSEGLVKQIHQHRVYVFSDALGFFEQPEQYQKAARMGVDVIQTDYVERVYQALATGK